MRGGRAAVEILSLHYGLPSVPEDEIDYSVRIVDLEWLQEREIKLLVAGISRAFNGK